MACLVAASPSGGPDFPTEGADLLALLASVAEDPGSDVVAALADPRNPAVLVASLASSALVVAEAASAEDPR